jgi:hypothetical protein
MLIQNLAGAALFFMKAPRATKPVFTMYIEQLLPYFECALSRLGYA